MVIIGLLAGFVAPRYFAQVGKSQVKAAQAQIDALDKALEQYRLDVGRLPSTEEGLAALQSRPAGCDQLGGTLPQEGRATRPLGSPTVRVCAACGSHQNDFDLLSYGRDGQPGGSGEDADLTNY